MIGLILRGKQIYDKFSRDEMTVYAAQASFFTIIAAFPFIMLLMAMIQLIPTITKSNLLMVITNIVPANLKSLVFGIVENIYTNSPAT
ncbi:YhjD/YihY/BrkB family envelope integrity protein, partial [Hungatella sp.]